MTLLKSLLCTLVFFACPLMLNAKSPNYQGSSLQQQTKKISLLTQDTFQDTLNSCPYLVVDFFADWCGPCKSLAPIFEQVAGEYGNNYCFAKVNADRAGDLLQRYNVKGLPTVVFFKDGKEVGRHVGFMSKDVFVKELKQAFNK